MNLTILTHSKESLHMWVQVCRYAGISVPLIPPYRYQYQTEHSYQYRYQANDSYRYQYCSDIHTNNDTDTGIGIGIILIPILGIGGTFIGVMAWAPADFANTETPKKAWLMVCHHACHISVRTDCTLAQENLDYSEFRENMKIKVVYILKCGLFDFQHWHFFLWLPLGMVSKKKEFSIKGPDLPSKDP